MIHLRGASLALAIGVLLGGAAMQGCQWGDSQARAQRELSRELRERRQQRAQATRLYDDGLKQYERSELEDARRTLEQAIRVDRTYAPAWMALGVVTFELDLAFDAAHAFDQAAQLRPDRYEPHYNLGQVFESVGRFRRAIESYERALDLSPTQIEVMENLARCYIAANEQPDRARELIDQALGMETRPQWVHWLREQRRILGDDRALTEESLFR